jgi:hypothetical protein
MSKLDLPTLGVLDLLQTYAEVIEELRRRGIVRTSNNPVGDYAEWLVSTSLGLHLDGNSQRGYDATGTDGRRYQIKGRRITPRNKSTQLSVIRNLATAQFDFLIAVIFDGTFSLLYAAQLPHAVVTRLATFREHVNGHILHVPETIFDEAGVLAGCGNKFL